MDSNYILHEVAWEITMACNLRCGHCGSNCTTKLPGELTTDQALELIDDLMRLSPNVITLLGGEPFVRKDWYILCKKLSEYDVKIRFITNGTLMTDEVIYKLKDIRADIVSVSIDGYCESHNRMRQQDCYHKSMDSLRAMKEAGIPTGVNTTLTTNNVKDLPLLQKELQKVGVLSWLLQIGISMGRMAQKEGLMLLPEDVENIIDYAFHENQRTRYPKIFLADSIGYYSCKDIMARYNTGTHARLPIWDGCNAGIRSLGICHNGDVTGCISIRDRGFKEGNVLERSIVDIWNDENSFAWRRKLTPEKMEGHCKSCIYVKKCLGGCTNMRLYTNGNIYVSNNYCIYQVKVMK